MEHQSLNSDSQRITNGIEKGLLGTDPVIAIERLAGDASTRNYYRAIFKNHNSIILMLSPNPGAGEANSFIDVQNFLARLELPVPEIISHDEDLGITCLEDLGDVSLESRAAESDSSEIRRLYEEAILILVKLRKRTDRLSDGSIAFTLAFDHKKLMEEMEFFSKHFLQNYLNIHLSGNSKAALYELFERTCSILADQRRFFTHRDYHCRNLMVHNGRLVMIDFQDARMGPAQYDPASLLRDSYITLDDKLVEDLLKLYFIETRHDKLQNYDEFIHIFNIMALQRNIKALGTFGFQVSVKGNPRFMDSIPRTANHIARNMENLTEFSEYRNMVTDLIVDPALASQSYTPPL